MKVRVEIDTAQLKQLVVEKLLENIKGGFDVNDVVIEVKSSQNYHVLEWERGDFRAVYEGEV